MQPQMNKTVLMSGAEYFDDGQAINPFMDSTTAVDIEKAIAEHILLQQTLERLGVTVIKTPAPPRLQDGVYTANWALVRDNTAVLSSLPPSRQGEKAYAEAALKDLGKTVVYIPDGLKFSGQGDALACGNYLFCGSGYRTDPEVHSFLAETLGYEVIGLHTVPQVNEQGQPVINSVSGWADSYFYDLDLALAVLRFPSQDQKGLIAWCPEAFTPESRTTLANLNSIDTIEVGFAEAREGFACNLVSTGGTVIMSADVPDLQVAIEACGLQTVTLSMPELAKGGGFIRCTTLTIDNS